MYSNEGKIWVAASIVLYKKIFGLFKTMNSKNTYIQIYETFTLPRLPLTKLFVDLLHQQKVKS